jgi:hypothetical protein
MKVMKRVFRPRVVQGGAPALPDLHSQFEALLDTVWESERRAAIMDRIDAQAADDSRRRRRSSKGR